MLSFAGVTRVYREAGAPPRRALDGVTFTLPPGSICGVAGANGAGKTTLLRLAATLDRPTSGRVLLDGVDPREDGAAARRGVAYAGQEPGLYETLTVRENLAFVARFHQRLADVGPVAERFGLTRHLDRAARALSRGERQRASLARAWLGGPLLLLDEPTTALDDEGRARLVAALDDARGTRTALLATHETDLLAKCDRVLRLRDGTLEAGA